MRSTSNGGKWEHITINSSPSTNLEKNNNKIWEQLYHSFQQKKKKKILSSGIWILLLLSKLWHNMCIKVVGRIKICFHPFFLVPQKEKKNKRLHMLEETWYHVFCLQWKNHGRKSNSELFSLSKAKWSFWNWRLVSIPVESCPAASFSLGKGNAVWGKDA